MLEGLVAWILNNYLGKYVENLNTDQLSIALLSGAVELENLPLRKDALRHFGLPIEVRAGFIGKVKLQIPFRQIRSAAWTINMEQLYLVAGPVGLDQWDAESEDIALQEIKQSALNNLEAKWRAETEVTEQNGYYASSYSTWISYGSGLMTNIAENLQLIIKDVHIRYEDDITVPRNAFGCGITIESLSVQSCDSNWIPGFTTQWTVSSFKLVELSNMAVYWDPIQPTVQLFGNLNRSDLAVAMTFGITSKHFYIMKPVTAQAHITRDRSEQPLRSKTFPRIISDLCLNEVCFSLANWQYDQVIQCFRGLDDIARLRSYRIYRPSFPIKECPRAWWIYGIRCFIGTKSFCLPKPSWDSCLQRAKENCKYVQICINLFSNPAISLNADDKVFKDHIEWNYDLDDLLILREIAMRKVPVIESDTQNRSMLMHWFPQWLGWYSTEQTKQTEFEGTSNLEDEFLDAIGSDTFENNSLLKRDVVFGRFNFTLKRGTFHICSAVEPSVQRKPSLELQYENVKLSIESRPRNNSHKFNIALGALYLHDRLTKDTQFPLLISPQGSNSTSQVISSRSVLSPRLNQKFQRGEPIFELSYEQRPFNSKADFKLWIKSQSLDIVYNPNVTQWLTSFLVGPDEQQFSLPSHTKISADFIKNWETILEGDSDESIDKKSWDLQLDISAPQIIIVEEFTDRNAAVVVIDFGRLKLCNTDTDHIPFTEEEQESDEDMFMTPCSTPPGSEVAGPTTRPGLNRKDFSLSIYDHYTVELNDLQILAGKVKDNWKFAYTKGTSSLHVLDRFNISLKIDRLAVQTSDTLYPNLKLSANLPKLVVHVNEQKIITIRKLCYIISPPSFGVTKPSLIKTNVKDSECMSTLSVFQFSIDKMALEVQSRNRSVAELQVAGVRAALTKRAKDASISLSVHGLLLVDALQTFGTDFELLVASHKHVGMDSLSGSLRDSEPCSPTSPGSPELNKECDTSAVALTQALSNLGVDGTRAVSPPRVLLTTSPSSGYFQQNSTEQLDLDALIIVDVLIVNGVEHFQQANIQFNNLDIIANQETIVELMGFARRIFPDVKPSKTAEIQQETVVEPEPDSLQYDQHASLHQPTKTEIVFDFHRLNVLLLRAIVKDGCLHGRKVATATMSEARIQATVDSSVLIEGSLGGLQVLDLTCKNHIHQRIISVGKDPLIDRDILATLNADLYKLSSSELKRDQQAFSFSVKRALLNENDQAEITLRMASVWYTHSPQLLLELQSCATEFKQYLANFAKSIKTAATDMAIGLVRARTEALAQTLYINSRISSSLYGGMDINSPRRRKRSYSQSSEYSDIPSGYASLRGTTPQTPDESDVLIDVKLDVVLDTPVIVLPRAVNSTQVFVAHLGQITINNQESNKKANDKLVDWNNQVECYNIEVKDMNLYSLDVPVRKDNKIGINTLIRSEDLYNCKEFGYPILHDTMLHVYLQRVTGLETESGPFHQPDVLQIYGSVITPVKLSLSRSQYEQVLDTFQTLVINTEAIQDHHDLKELRSSILEDIAEEGDVNIKERSINKVEKSKMIMYKLSYKLPECIIELRGDTGNGECALVDLSFRDLNVDYEKYQKHERNMQVSLRSLLFEDLTKSVDSKHRIMMQSSMGTKEATKIYLSSSCPDLVKNYNVMQSHSRASLPDHLETDCKLGASTAFTPKTPPPSPKYKKSNVHDNLVLISTLFVDSNSPNFKEKYNSVQKSTNVDFNCLDLIVNVESWVIVLDFFGLNSDPAISSNIKDGLSEFNLEHSENEGNSELAIEVKSLTLVLTQPEREVARANISNLSLSIFNHIDDLGNRKSISGRLGSMSLFDLTPHGYLYKERFITTGDQALKFNYVRLGELETESASYDAQLHLEMSSVFYVHTKRFLNELQWFYNNFSQIQAVMSNLRREPNLGKLNRPARVSIELNAGAPVILLPVNSRSNILLVADLGNLRVKNRFCIVDTCTLTVMLIDLLNMDLFSAKRKSILPNKVTDRHFDLGGYCVVKHGPSLLKEKCHFKLQVERNLDYLRCHNVPDMSIVGTLSTLNAAVDLFQYKLMKGLLAFNLGEDTPDLVIKTAINDDQTVTPCKEVWKVWSLRLDLVNVTVHLLPKHNEAPLSTINFIKSKLTVESFSDFTEDIDLISQEIQLLDSRFNEYPINKRSNVFTNILKPIHNITQGDDVQAELHSRKRQDYSKFTILLNNIRLMAILDWWEAIRDFIFEPPDVPPIISVSCQRNVNSESSTFSSTTPFELKLNITDSEVVIVEDTSQWDTNAVILKSTTVISFRPHLLEKSLSCNLNHCEMFSCILGMEDETALSIIDPVTVNMEVNKDRILEIQLHNLNLRLSYHDMMMFAKMLSSITNQTKKVKSQKPPANITGEITKLSALGFSESDCLEALSTCCGQLDDAALWLTQHAQIDSSNRCVQRMILTGDSNFEPVGFKIIAVEIKTNCFSICVIDDCGDSDVPLLELSFSQLQIRQVIDNSNNIDIKPNFQNGDGWLECTLSGYYYNRMLSGWEPFIEPWICEFGWEFTLTPSLQKNRLQLRVQSDHILNFNITSTFIGLFNQVKQNWLQDYYNIISKDPEGSPAGYRRRSPFIPFALRNETGSKLSFKTFVTNVENRTILKPDDLWIEVLPGETIPFSFARRDKLRHRDTHILKIHKLGVQVHDWKPTDPVSVDKVGIYFRYVDPQVIRSSDIPRAKIVFDVALEGSARKLVTIRSALQVTNRLQDIVEIKMENVVNSLAGSVPPMTVSLLPKATLSIPLTHVNSKIFIRPSDSRSSYMFCNKPLRWSHVNTCAHESRECRNQREKTYRFMVIIRRENYPMNTDNYTRIQPAHTFILRPAILVTNLLPYDLHFATFCEQNGRVAPGEKSALNNINLELPFEIKFHLDNFPGVGTLIITSNVSSFNGRLHLKDHSKRRLFLNVNIEIYRGCGVDITVSSPFWIINKTGVPLVFRQEGIATETAGQFEEHEIARMVAPLLFSLTDPELNPTVVARVGNGVIRSGQSQWCNKFNLVPGCQTRKLRIVLRDHRPDIIYVMGIDVRPGRGRYRETTIVTISPRYQLHNKSSYQLQFSQKCFATTVKDPGAQATYLRAVPNCHMAFHWPRLDREQLLCVRILDISDCCWSGGLRIDSNYSLHINIRDINRRMYFLRLDVVLQGATFFIIFTDADTMPPPIRVDNYSEVLLTFSQASCITYRSTTRPHSSVPYALDEPTEPPVITVTAPGCVSANYDMNVLGDGPQLTYENFIYIAFIGTFKNTSDTLDVESQQLVLDVTSNGRVILERKQTGQRSQLWRMSSSGQLIHEGSSPPRAPQQPHSDKCLVLDIEGPGPQPSTYSGLILRKPDPRRKSTQTWHFTDDNRLCCAHNNMCVQVQDGFFGLRSGASAVLGLINSGNMYHRFTDTGIPLEHAIGRQRLRPGSGFLKIVISTDGPTRVLKIFDIKERRIYAMPEENNWANHPVTQYSDLMNPMSAKILNEYQLSLLLTEGIGVSIVSRQSLEELLFGHFRGITLECVLTPSGKTLDISVADIQCDNQLYDATSTSLIYVTRRERGEEDKIKLPALHITAEINSSPNVNAIIFKHLLISLKPMAVYLEEKLLLKIFAFANYQRSDQEFLDTDETDCEIQKILHDVTATHAKRYYFGIIKIAPSQIRLSVITASKLDPQLQIIKRKLGLTLIKFEDAAVDLEPFLKQHPFESSHFLIHSILKHFKEELKWQAANILGSVDFLGNPLGFVNDVSEGVSGLIYEGNVGALVKNVTHGISNSAAKVTETLSDGLGKVTMDDEHEEMRLRIRQSASSGNAHIVAGVKGLGFGILGGATGIFKQIYEGASQEGVQGVFAGLGKGLVGAVTKPVVGVLDLASETARAVRDSSRSRASPQQYRPPRCVIGPSGLLPLYSKAQAIGQQNLYLLNNRDFSEFLVAYEILQGAPDDLRIIVSNKLVRVVTKGSSHSSSSLTVVIESPLRDLLECIPVTAHESNRKVYYIELIIRIQNQSDSSHQSVNNELKTRRPCIRCDSQSLAIWVAEQVNYARNMYEECRNTLVQTNQVCD